MSDIGSHQTTNRHSVGTMNYGNGVWDATALDKYKFDTGTYFLYCLYGILNVDISRVSLIMYVQSLRVCCCAFVFIPYLSSRARSISHQMYSRVRS